MTSKKQYKWAKWAFILVFLFVIVCALDWASLAFRKDSNNRVFQKLDESKLVTAKYDFSKEQNIDSLVAHIANATAEETQTALYFSDSLKSKPEYWDAVVVRPSDDSASRPKSDEALVRKNAEVTALHQTNVRKRKWAIDHGLEIKIDTIQTIDNINSAELMSVRLTYLEIVGLKELEFGNRIDSAIFMAYFHHY